MGAVITFIYTLILGLLPVRSQDILYACKWILSYLSIRIYKILKKDRLDFFDVTVTGQPDKVGYLPHATEEQLESPHSELHLAKADDGIFFYGVNSAGDFLIISIARLRSQKADATVYLRLASGKVYELTKKSDFQQSSANKNAFTCGGLQAYYLCPMRRWRIFYSGYLKETSEESPKVHRMTYVKFSFLWRASSNVYDSTADISETDVINSVAKEEWRNILPPTHKLYNVLDFYAQAGVLRGTLTLEETQESSEFYLFGERIRFLGDVMLSKEIEFSHTLGFIHRNGMYLHFGQVSANHIATNVNYGFIVKPNGNLRKIENQDFSVKTESDDGNVQEIRGSIKADSSYMFCGSVLRPTICISNKEKTISMNKIKFFLDGKRGTGIHIRGKYRMSPTRKSSVVTLAVNIPECVHPLVIAFTEDLCQLPEITGGKGSSLGKLTSLSGELQTFTVPAGVVVTTSSYKHFITQDILNEIKYLEDVLYGNKTGDVKEVSKRVCDKIVATKLPNPVVDNIVKHLNKVFGDGYNSVRFAIRSSATGEDTEQMSAAGQMETFLGITGLNNILSALKKCWASQFGFTAIQYKRRYGQCVNTPMAVVIQEMVACDVAGVIFTCDPVSGNASRMSIAANFGIGESVVSASVDPDTIELARDENDELRIHSVTAGQKSQKVILTDDGTKFEDNPEDEREKCCLSTEDIFQLGNLAIKIEKYYRSKRDIEWGIKNSNLFLFQSRPVTSGAQETDFEIEHEFDGALRVEHDYFSVSHAAEVLPGVMTPLARDMFLKMFGIVWQKLNDTIFHSGIKNRYFDCSWFTMNGHVMCNIPDVLHKSNPKEHSKANRATMVSLFGRVIDNKEIFQVAYERYSYDQKMSWKSVYSLFKNLMFSGKRLKNTHRYYANYRLPIEKYSTSKDLFIALMQHCCDLLEGQITHIMCSQASSLWNMLILNILMQEEEGIDQNVYTDFARLIKTKQYVESADVPAAIENLVHHITKSIKPEDFKAMKKEEALRWLQETPSLAGKKFSEFLIKHGHRCVKEFDIYSTTWGSNPISLVPLLQELAANTSSGTAGKANTSLFKEIMQIKSPIGLLSKLKLLLIVPLSRKGVREREASKSLVVKNIDAWRKAVWALAKLMVSEGRIPDEKILFFMPFEDIKQLFDNRSPKVLAKAYHRQRLYPKMDKYLFPEIMRGVPKPINEIEEGINFEDSDTLMKGTPVSQGVAKGYLRVAITLDEAAQLKHGEILLAYGTDIGWSPYFPILSGVATELGGLISHGAVVSREYGLPCVVSLLGATRRFQTGDYVLLDGNKGILQKIPSPENKNTDNHHK